MGLGRAMPISLTGLIIIVVFVVILGYTAISRKYGQPTISMQLRDWGYEYNSTVYVAGVLIGHWYLNSLHPIQGLGWITLIPFALYLAYDIVWAAEGFRHGWYRWPLIPFVLGIVFGAIFWGQASPHAPF